MKSIRLMNPRDFKTLLTHKYKLYCAPADFFCHLSPVICDPTNDRISLSSQFTQLTKDHVSLILDSQLSILGQGPNLKGLSPTIQRLFAQPPVGRIAFYMPLRGGATTGHPGG